MKNKLNFIALISLLLVIVLTFSSCGLFGTACVACVAVDYFQPEDKVKLDLPEYDDYDFYRDGVFRDHIDYAKYYYSDVDESILDKSKYLKKIDSSNIDIVKRYIDDFTEHGGLFEDGEINQYYDFDSGIIEEGDYYYVEDNVDEEDSIYIKRFDRYNFYYFDTESQTLYFFDKFV